MNMGLQLYSFCWYPTPPAREILVIFPQLSLILHNGSFSSVAHLPLSYSAPLHVAYTIGQQYREGKHWGSNMHLKLSWTFMFDFSYDTPYGDQGQVGSLRATYQESPTHAFTCSQLSTHCHRCYGPDTLTNFWLLAPDSEFFWVSPLTKHRLYPFPCHAASELYMPKTGPRGAQSPLLSSRYKTFVEHLAGIFIGIHLLSSG